MINWHIQKLLARAFAARIIFVNTLHSKFTVFHKNLLYEKYAGMHTMIIKIYIHTNKYIT